MTPAEAVAEIKPLRTNYTLGDFILIRENALATYDGPPGGFDEDEYLGGLEEE